MKSLVSTLREKPILLTIPVALGLALTLFIVKHVFTDHTRYVTGNVEATKVNIAAKIPARIKAFRVDEGSAVAPGDTLITFENREVEAKVEQAHGALGAAEAKYRMALNGARREEITMADNAAKQAEWNVEGLKKSYDRLQALHREGVISSQQWDEMDYRYRAAVELRDAAKAKLALVREGARPEEKDAALSLVKQARNAVAEAESYYDETTLCSPIKGFVERKIVEEGELVAPGYALISIVNPESWWVIVNIDEKHLGTMQVGGIISCLVPSRDGGRVDMRIARIAALSDFATKKATNELNSFDLRTFEVKLVPADASLKLAQGLTVLVPISR